MTVRSGLVAATAGVLVLGLGAAPATRAAFTDRAVVESGTHTSGSMTAPATPTVTQTAGTGATHVSWTASRVGTRGAVPTAYEVYRYAASTGGAPTLACSVVVGTRTALACDDPSRAAGTQHYAVRARFGERWQAESTRRAFAADRAGPTAAVEQPADGYRGNANTLRRDLTRACGPDAPACGTATDPAGVSSVTWALAYLPTGPRPTSRCWNGSRFEDQPAEGVCAESAASTTTAAGGLRWSVPGTADAVYRDRGTYTLTVVATDAFANSTTVTSVVTVT